MDSCHEATVAAQGPSQLEHTADLSLVCDPNPATLGAAVTTLQQL